MKFGNIVLVENFTIFNKDYNTANRKTEAFTTVGGNQAKFRV